MTLAEVGAKYLYLIRMIEAGLPVPPGAVLPTVFFVPWFDEIRTSKAWAALTRAPPDQWPILSHDLKMLCSRLSLSSSQRQAMKHLRENIAAFGEDALLAVRSSSPEEDLTSASFAGNYATRLGVRVADLDDAVRYCFASTFDERVLTYKREHGFDFLSPRIAVIVQQQIDSEASGVGFSLNPLTNDYDEVVIDANWGQGESVVAGLVSPDQFIIDKIERQPIRTKLGAKQISIWLDPRGGTVERVSHRSTELTLSEAQVGELTETICQIETLFATPVDVEWTYADGQLYVLQARPITAYVPLPPEMVTKPGERRRLYADAALSKGMTTNAPFSPMQLDGMRDLLSSFLDDRLGIEVTPDKGLVFAAGGRLYMNISNMLWLASPKAMAKATLPNDILMGQILANVDARRYRAATRPPWIRLGMLLSVFRVVWLARGLLWTMLSAIVAPERAHKAFERSVKAYDESIATIDCGLPLVEFNRQCFAAVWRQPSLGVVAAAVSAVARVDPVAGTKSAETQALAEKLKLGFTGDVVVEMGIALFRLAKLLDPPDFEDIDRLSDRIERREMPPEFMNAWDAFLSSYGWRGPLEMDLASPRYADRPGLALRQMCFMSGDSGFDPESAHRRHVEERQQAYEALMDRLSWWRKVLLHRLYRIIDLFAGTRDTPKHQIVLAGYALRKRVLSEGRRLTQQGRLDAADDVFDLTFGDLESARLDCSLDLRAVREERTRFLTLLKAQVTHFPQVIDSRGRILRPAAREEAPGELKGTAVSPGVVTGPVKVLRNPYEKAVNRGDVLVAYTTDPGWTPLFVNAAAVVLEIGGMLQHGAVVAREYGKPCVVGIDQAMTRLQDGETVEVDGTRGVVRILPDSDKNAVDPPRNALESTTR